jgi:hypothetical protein
LFAAFGGWLPDARITRGQYRHFRFPRLCFAKCRQLTSGAQLPCLADQAKNWTPCFCTDAQPRAGRVVSGFEGLVQPAARYCRRNASVSMAACLRIALRVPWACRRGGRKWRCSDCWRR